MALSIQYYNGTDYTQFGLDVADYTTTGGVANTFFTVKDSNDTVYILAIYVPSGYTTTYSFKFIKITSSGTKSVATMASYYPTIYCSILLSRDESKLFFVTGQSSIDRKLYSVNVADIVNSGTITPTVVIDNVATTNINVPFAIYQDRYIWVASGTTVKIYDYTTKAELASIVNAYYGSTTTISLSTDNNLFVSSTYDVTKIHKLVFNGVTTITATLISLSANSSSAWKQTIIDKYGDLIILTNSGSASTLLKYTTAGAQTGTTLALGGAFYNLNTDKDGNYYYSNAIGTYKITANTAQGQAFSGVGTKIRGSGMTTYGSNITGYAPAVFGEQ